MDEELFVVTGCCNIKFQIARGRRAAVKALGENVDPQHKAAVNAFLEGKTEGLANVLVERSHWRAIISADEAK